LTCDRILQEPFHFCCLSCKVQYYYIPPPIQMYTYACMLLRTRYQKIFYMHMHATTCSC
jgi:hypothetical protein